MFYESLVNVPPIIDFEASSLHETCSYPISCGLVVGGHSYYWIIKPEPTWSDWSPQSQLIHGLTRDDLLQHGIPASQVRTEILAALANQDTVYSDAPQFERLWGNKLGLHSLRVLDLLTLIAVEKASRFPTQFSCCLQREKLKKHHAEHDAIALAMAVNDLSG